jgi:hypothetical protein
VVCQFCGVSVCVSVVCQTVFLWCVRLCFCGVSDCVYWTQTDTPQNPVVCQFCGVSVCVSVVCQTVFIGHRIDTPQNPVVCQFCGVSVCVYYHFKWSNTPGWPKLRYYKITVSVTAQGMNLIFLKCSSTEWPVGLPKGNSDWLRSRLKYRQHHKYISTDS